MMCSSLSYDLFPRGCYSRRRQKGAKRARSLSSLPDALKTSWTYPKEVIPNDAQSWERGSES